MTSALWLLYLADVFASASIVLVFWAIGCAVFLGGRRVGAALEDRGVTPAPGWVFKSMLAALAFAVIIPSKTTIYAIAAVHVGDAALRTQTGDRAIRALNSWLDEQIDGSDQGNSQ